MSSTNSSAKSDETCPYCRSSITPPEPARVCPECHTPHHEDCWDENRGCTVFGCSMAPPDEEKISVDAPPTDNEEKNQLPPPPNSEPIFFFIPLSRLVIMSIFAPGFFHVYWIYKNLLYLRNRDGDSSNAGWELAVSFACKFFSFKFNSNSMSPFSRGLFGVFHCHGLLKAIQNDQQANELEKATFSASLLATGWVFLTVVGALFTFSSEAHISFLGILGWTASFVFLLPVQDYINRINQRYAPRSLYSPWSSGQIASLLAGIVFWFILFYRMI